MNNATHVIIPPSISFNHKHTLSGKENVQRLRMIGQYFLYIIQHILPSIHAPGQLRDAIAMLIDVTDNVRRREGLQTVIEQKVGK